MRSQNVCLKLKLSFNYWLGGQRKISVKHTQNNNQDPKMFGLNYWWRWLQAELALCFAKNYGDDDKILYSSRDLGKVGVYRTNMNHIMHGPGATRARETTDKRTALLVVYFIIDNSQESIFINIHVCTWFVFAINFIYFSSSICLKAIHLLVGRITMFWFGFCLTCLMFNLQCVVDIQIS